MPDQPHPSVAGLLAALENLRANIRQTRTDHVECITLSSLSAWHSGLVEQVERNLQFYDQTLSLVIDGLRIDPEPETAAQAAERRARTVPITDAQRDEWIAAIRSAARTTKNTPTG